MSMKFQLRSNLKALTSPPTQPQIPASLQATSDFKESDHPRKDDGKFGSGSNSSDTPKSHAVEVKSAISKFPKSDIKLESSEVPTASETERKAQLERMKTELTSHETAALDSFMGGNFQAMRKAEVDGKPPDEVREAKKLSRAIERFERKSKPVQCFRGLHLPPDVAESLMSSDTFDCLATSMWSAQPSLGAQFSAGMSAKGRASSVPVVLIGDLKGLAADGDYGVEILIRNKTLKITGRESYEHPKFGTICVLRVSDQ